MNRLRAALGVALLYPLSLFLRKEFVPAAFLLLAVTLLFGIAMACLSDDELCTCYTPSAEEQEAEMM
jgi:hypothetical protein